MRFRRTDCWWFLMILKGTLIMKSEHLPFLVWKMTNFGAFWSTRESRESRNSSVKKPFGRNGVQGHALFFPKRWKSGLIKSIGWSVCGWGCGGWKKFPAMGYARPTARPAARPIDRIFQVPFQFPFQVLWFYPSSCTLPISDLKIDHWSISIRE